jgi:hypothetical protein
MRLTRKTVVVLVVLAVLLAIITIFSMAYGNGERVSTSSSGSAVSSDAGKVGVSIVAPTVEDKLAGDGNGG